MVCDLTSSLLSTTSTSKSTCEKGLLLELRAAFTTRVGSGMNVEVKLLGLQVDYLGIRKVEASADGVHVGA